MLEQVLFLRLEDLVRLRWRHHVVRVRGGDARPKFALLQTAWHNGGFVFGSALENTVLCIDPQTGLARVIVRTMTGETVLGENGPNVAVKLNSWRSCCHGP